MDKKEFESLVKGDRVELENGETGTVDETPVNQFALIDLDEVKCASCSPYYNKSEIKKKLNPILDV